jgi:hypothetical protein
MCESPLTLLSKLEKYQQLPDASDATSVAVNDASQSSVFLKETNPLSAAFEQACLSRPEDQIIALRKAKGLKELFEQLECSNQKSNDESLFRRGAKRLQPTLGVIGGGMGFVGSLTALDPIANNAFGIVQSITTVRNIVGSLAITVTDSPFVRLPSESVAQRCSLRNMSKR